MDKKERELFLVANGNKFRPERILMIDKMLERADSLTVYSTELKSPSVVLIISLLAGQLGIDRYLLGDKKIGTVKLALFLSMYISVFVMSFGIVNLEASKSGSSEIALFTIVYLTIFCTLLLAVTVFWIYDATAVSGRTKDVNFQRLCYALDRNDGHLTPADHLRQANNSATDPSITN